MNYTVTTRRLREGKAFYFSGIVCLIFFVCSQAEGRIFFLPGDAFFHVRFDAKVSQRISNWDRGSFLLHYEPPTSSPPAAGGHAGFWKCNLDGCDRELLLRLQRCSGFVLQGRRGATFGGTLRPAKGETVHCFIYGTDFDYRRYHVGLKYNEKWVDPLKNEVFGDGAPDIISSEVYASFDDGREMLIEDWLNCERVAGLSVELPPNVNWNRLGPYLKDGITIKVDSVYFVLVNGSQLQGVIRRNKGSWFCEASKDGQWIVEWNGSQWKRSPIDNTGILAEPIDLKERDRRP